MMTASEEALAGGKLDHDVPEGTRSADGRLKPFKPGAFVLAKRMQVPLLPIVVRGTSRALPKRGFVLQGRHRIHIDVREEIPPESFADISAEELTERMHALFAAELGEIPDEAVAAGLDGASGWRSPRAPRARPPRARDSLRGDRSRAPSPA
jgi:1-acyl-sn-glycerol-3-phosphate acyltransferase